VSSTPSTLETAARWQRFSLAAGVLGLGICLVAALSGYSLAVQQSWLVAFTAFAGVAVGCLGVLMLQYLTGGAWGFILRRPLEAGTRTLPLVALLFVPLLVPLFLPESMGVSSIFPWASAEEMKNNPTLASKASYLNAPFFLIRALIYFAIWNGLMVLLDRWSREQDRTRDPGLSDRCEGLSGPGLVLLGVTVTFAAIDWMMSLEPEWYSTIYGALVGVGFLLSGFTFAVVVLLLLGANPPLDAVLVKGNLRDLGSLLLAFVMVWAYLAFSQYLLIWSGNLPEEVVWYIRRTADYWQFIALALMLFHFALPFALLLSGNVKRHRRTLLAVALLVLVMRVFDLAWLIVPAFTHTPEGAGTHSLLLDLCALIGVGGVWLSVYLWQVRQLPLLPLYVPPTEEVAAHHG
jgi:hypothetical protein